MTFSFLLQCVFRLFLLLPASFDVNCSGCTVPLRQSVRQSSCRYPVKVMRQTMLTLLTIFKFQLHLKIMKFDIKGLVSLSMLSISAGHRPVVHTLG